MSYNQNANSFNLMNGTGQNFGFDHSATNMNQTSPLMATSHPSQYQNVSQMQNAINNEITSLSLDDQHKLLQLQIQEVQAAQAKFQEQLQANSQNANNSNSNFQTQRRANSFAYPPYPQQQQQQQQQQQLQQQHQQQQQFPSSNNMYNNFNPAMGTLNEESNMFVNNAYSSNKFQAQPNGDFTISPHSSISSSSISNNSQFQSPTNLMNNVSDTNNANFNLPIELQGGVNNIFNRRPSFAAEVQSMNNSKLGGFINSVNPNTKSNMKQYAMQYNHLNNQRKTIYENTRNNSIDYSRFQLLQKQLPPPHDQKHHSLSSHSSSNSSISMQNNGTASRTDGSGEFDSIFIQLDDGLLLNKSTNSIVTSPELKEEFEKCTIYFGDINVAMQVVDQLNNLLGISNGTPNQEIGLVQRRVDKLLHHLLKQNEDLKSSTHIGNKNYSLILNKNGRLDIISFPKNSNLQLMFKDLIIIEGDRGKDLVMVLKPIIDFKFALFFNYLKKKLHLKSLEFGNDTTQSNSNNSNGRNQHGKGHSNNNGAQPKSIINEDENFITLPNKQILRFAKPHELSQLVLKYNDEVMAYRICLNYSASLNLNLIIKNVEFQFDKKKLIIYYYCLQRLDFRGLIKELFKIYKTRIWLCAILPLEKSYKPLLDYELEKRNIDVSTLENITFPPVIMSAITPNEKSDSSDSLIDPLTVVGGKLSTANDKLLTPPASAPPSSATSTSISSPKISYRSNSYVVQDELPKADQIYQFSEIKDPIYFHSKIFSNLINMFEFEILNPSTFKDRYWFLGEST